MAITGLLAEALHYARLEPHRQIAYFAHLVVVFALGCSLLVALTLVPNAWVKTQERTHERVGKRIEGLDTDFADDQKVFHAGTALDGDDVVTAGGRVLCVVGLGDSVATAAERAYDAADKIHWEEAYLRRDIGHRAIAREQD